MNDSTATRPDTAPSRATGIDPATVRGWGVDADPTNNPTHPYRDRSKDDHSGSWKRPSHQHTRVEILQSIEHKQRPAVVGTSIPPAGLSGMLRRLAFRKSESNLLHWMLLLGADRIGMVEGVARDLAQARVPDIPGEMGMRAGWQHNKRGVVLKTVLTVGLLSIAAAAMMRPRRPRPRRLLQRR